MSFDVERYAGPQDTGGLRRTLVDCAEHMLFRYGDDTEVGIAENEQGRHYFDHDGVLSDYVATVVYKCAGPVQLVPEYDVYSYLVQIPKGYKYKEEQRGVTYMNLFLDGEGGYRDLMQVAFANPNYGKELSVSVNESVAYPDMGLLPDVRRECDEDELLCVETSLHLTASALHRYYAESGEVMTNGCIGDSRVHMPMSPLLATFDLIMSDLYKELNDNQP